VLGLQYCTSIILFARWLFWWTHKQAQMLNCIFCLRTLMEISCLLIVCMFHSGILGLKSFWACCGYVAEGWVVFDLKNLLMMISSFNIYKQISGSETQFEQSMHWINVLNWFNNLEYIRFHVSCKDDSVISKNKILLCCAIGKQWSTFVQCLAVVRNVAAVGCLQKTVCLR